MMKKRRRIGSQQELVSFVADDVKKSESISYPIRATFFERFFVTKVPVSWVHPNPDDDFSSEEVGASFKIVNQYREMARENRWDGKPYFVERIIVEKMSGGGYLIINGHHRWAAATLEGFRFVDVRIVNLTHLQDLHHMLDKSVRDKRALLDLDEVILTATEGEPEDKNPSVIGRFFYREKIKVGRIALLNALHKMGYDVWVYTRGYLSSDYINKLFSFYNVKIEGIINGVGRSNNELNNEKFREAFERKYERSLHIDVDNVSYRDLETRKLIRKEIEADDMTWSRHVLDIITEIEKGK